MSNDNAPTKSEQVHARSQNAQAIQESREGVWYLKQIHFRSQPKKIITQNYNGPCSFIAICNILILRDDIEILPPERTSVSYELLSQLVGEYLLRASPDVDLSAALSMMPVTQKGMDLNPLFTSPTAFRPAGDAGALKLFEQARIELVHGWLVDPSSPEYEVIARAEDYDNAVNLIVAADIVAKGQFVVDENAAGPSGSSSQAGPSHVGEHLSDEDHQKVEDAIVVRQFLDSSSSQLTYHGLFSLASQLEPGSLVALFRNSHLAVLYKPEGDDSGIFSLVTDVIFYNETSIVWERLDDVDGGSSTYVDAEFKRSSPAGGDFAGHTAESALAAFEAEAGIHAHFDPADRELARQLQEEEDAYAQRVFAEREMRRQQSRQNPRQLQQQQQQQRGGYAPPQGPPPQRQGSGQDAAEEEDSDNEDPSPRPDQRNGRIKPMKMKRDKSCIIM